MPPQYPQSFAYLVMLTPRSLLLPPNRALRPSDYPGLGRSPRAQCRGGGQFQLCPPPALAQAQVGFTSCSPHPGGLDLGSHPQAGLWGGHQGWRPGSWLVCGRGSRSGCAELSLQRALWSQGSCHHGVSRGHGWVIIHPITGDLAAGPILAPGGGAGEV